MSQLDRTSPEQGQPLSRVARLAGRALGRRWRLPAAPARCRCSATSTSRCATARCCGRPPPPDHGGPHPTILLRSPYGRGGQFTVWLAALRRAATPWWCRACRGTFGSGGEFEPVVNEEHDGQDTVAWLREQPWFDGRMATARPELPGLRQWALRDRPAPELETMITSHRPARPRPARHQDGAFAARQPRRLDRAGRPPGAARGWCAARPAATAERQLAPRWPAAAARARRRSCGGNPAPWYRRVGRRTRTSATPTGNATGRRAALQTSNVPALLVERLAGLVPRADLCAVSPTCSDRGVEVGMTVGPWAHLDDGPTAWPRGPEGLDWLGRAPPVTRRAAAGRSTGAGVRHRGRGSGATCPTGRRRLGRADLVPRARRLPWATSRRGPVVGPTTFQYDPADPTPSVGGRLLARGAGRRDNRKLEPREDVLHLHRRRWPRRVELLGGASVRLSRSSDNPYADVFVRLCDVDPRGHSLNVTDRLMRLDPARVRSRRRGSGSSSCG